MEQWVLRVACDVPVVVSQSGLFDYLPTRSELVDGSVLDLDAPEDWVGRAVLVPFGRTAHGRSPKCVVGWVFEVCAHTDVPVNKLKTILGVVPAVPRAQTEWLQLMRFMSRYYQCGLGEVSLPALPAKLRQPKGFQCDEQGVWQLVAGKRAWNAWLKVQEHPAAPSMSIAKTSPVRLNPQQQAVLDDLIALTHSPDAPAPQLLFGVTGSGKTEVYLQFVAHVLGMDACAQVLILVPEINLTPQFIERLTARFGQEGVVSLHSGLNDGERLGAWWRAVNGHARIVLGTRLSVLTLLPHLRAIVVDEEHDASYRQQEGVRYSARDIAIYRAHQLRIPIILGSATPSLETWFNAESGRYGTHYLRARAVEGALLPKVQLVNMAQQPAYDGLSQPLIDAVDSALTRGHMSLLFQNRRGYAPVVYCGHCGWMEDCQACSAHMVYHKVTRRLHCHHCGAQKPVPRACPECGNADVTALGQGTQRLEEVLATRWPEARIMRIDADTTRLKGALELCLEQISAQNVDIVVGTQMLTKGHDWPNLTVVGVLDADGGLFAQDFRAPERLFAQLQQVIGRSGRGQLPGQVLIQSRFVEHDLWPHLLAHDFNAFAAQELMVREQLGLPPFGATALLQVGADALKDALAFAQWARTAGLDLIAEQTEYAQVTLNAAVPMQMVRVKHSERAQLLIECPSRARLQQFLHQWQTRLIAHKSRLTWMIEVDPLDI